MRLVICVVAGVLTLNTVPLPVSVQPLTVAHWMVTPFLGFSDTPVNAYVPLSRVIVAPSLALDMAELICDAVLPAVQLQDNPEPEQAASAADGSRRNASRSSHRYRGILFMKFLISVEGRVEWMKCIFIITFKKTFFCLPDRNQGIWQIYYAVF